MQNSVFMKSPAGDMKEVVVSDPNRDLVPLMALGWRQVTEQPPATGEPAVPEPHEVEEEK